MRHPSTPYCTPATTPKVLTRNAAIYFPEVDKTCVYVFDRLTGFLENFLESGNLFCSATRATKTPLGVLFALSFSNELGIYSSWEAKQRDSPVVGAFVPVSLVVYGDDQFANLPVPFQNAMTLDKHDSAKPSGVLSYPNARYVTFVLIVV